MTALFCRCGEVMEYSAAKQRVICQNCQPLEITPEGEKPARRKPAARGGGVLRTPEPSEAQIQKEIMGGLHMRGWMVIRINGGGMKKGKSYVRFYTIYKLAAAAGLPDVIAFKGDGQGSGRFLMIEVKDRTGQLRPSQKRFIKWAGAFGVKVWVLRSGEAVPGMLKKIVRGEKAEESEDALSRA